jgi:2-oxo-4-hydroxy-4-carboxy-5-ureidoimidazoline decarboxylase
MEGCQWAGRDGGAQIGLGVNASSPYEGAMTLAELNALEREPFVRVIGPVFEHSPWIAEAAWNGRPFASIEALHGALCEVMRNAGEKPQLALIRAHPDLVGRLAREGRLTAESTREQASAGLDRLSPEEIAMFESSNKAYREKFGFPFVICARLNKKQAILAGFQMRLANTREQEIRTALGEIARIAELRLRDIVKE